MLVNSICLFLANTILPHGYPGGVKSKEKKI